MASLSQRITDVPILRRLMEQQVLNGYHTNAEPNKRRNEHSQPLNSHLTVMRRRLTFPKFTARTERKHDLLVSAHFDFGASHHRHLEK